MEEGALAGAGLAEDGDAFGGLDVEVDAAEHGDAGALEAVGLVEVVCGEQWHVLPGSGVRGPGVGVRGLGVIRNGVRGRGACRRRGEPGGVRQERRRGCRR